MNFDQVDTDIALLQNAIERDLLRAKAKLAQLAWYRSQEEARLFLAAALIRLGLVPGEPQEG